MKMAAFVWRCPGGHVRCRQDVKWMPALALVLCRRCGQTCERKPTRSRKAELDRRLLPHPALDREAVARLAAYDAAVDAALRFRQ